MSRFTDLDKEAIRNGALQPVGEVCEADRAGLVGMWREGKAGDNVYKQLPEELRSIVQGDFYTPDDYVEPADDSAEAYIAAARAVLTEKAPELADTYRDAVIEACTAAAAAHKGTSAREQAIIDRITAAFA